MVDFPVDVTIDQQDICNLASEQAQLIDYALRGKRVVIYGRRNTGKTSLLLNVVIPALQKKNKKTLCVFVDFLGVESQEDVETRLRRSIERAIVRAFPSRKYLNTLLQVASSLRPTIETDSLTGNISVTIATRSHQKQAELSELIERLGDLHKTNKVFIAFDEFQDICTVSGLTALIRGALQNLPGDLPVFICGSKKHLLASMFGPHKAPFSGWGTDLEIPTIRDDQYCNEYYAYATKRLKIKKIAIDFSAFRLLITQCDGVPESVNIVLDHIARKMSDVTIYEEQMRSSIAAVIDERRGRFEEQLTRFRGSSRLVITAIAKHGPIRQPKGKDFLALTQKLAPSTVFNVIRQLEQQADIYLTPDGYVVADPLLAIYLVRYH